MNWTDMKQRSIPAAVIIISERRGARFRRAQFTDIFNYTYLVRTFRLENYWGEGDMGVRHERV